MARVVKCQVTKEKGTSETFYAVKTKGLNEYYKDKETYENFVKNKENKQILMNYIANEFFYDQVIPPIFLKKLKEINMYDYDVILKTFQYKKDSFDYAMSLSFNSDFQKSAYIITVLKNLINEVYKRIKIEEKTLIKNTEDKVDLEVFNIDNVPINNVESNDITRFFEGDDLF